MLKSLVNILFFGLILLSADKVRIIFIELILHPSLIAIICQKESLTNEHLKAIFALLGILSISYTTKTRQKQKLPFPELIFLGISTHSHLLDVFSKDNQTIFLIFAIHLYKEIVLSISRFPQAFAFTFMSFSIAHVLLLHKVQLILQSKSSKTYFLSLRFESKKAALLEIKLINGLNKVKVCLS